ncbi:MAG: hypothetical protein M1482_10395 [Chloroflexi bacterium]|nr:hypothetical protein [Chloroflexota bacterium]
MAKLKSGKAKTGKTDFESIKKSVDAIVAALSEREFDKYEKVYLIDPDSATGKSTRENVKTLYDGHGHASIDAIVRTWNANRPKISVPTPDPRERGLTPSEVERRKQAREAAEKAEKFLDALLYRSDDVSQRDVTALLLKQFALFGEASAVIDNVLADEDDPECPFIFDVPNSKLCYPRYSRRKGLLAHVFKVQLTLADVRATYGAAADFLDGGDDDLVTLIDYIDREAHVVYVEEQPDRAIIDAAHNLKMIPRVSMLAGSSDFFEKERDKRQPFLYTYLKSGAWAARNLQLTLMNDNLTKYLNSPFVSITQNGQPVGIDFSRPFQEIPLRSGEEIHQLVKNIIPQEQLAFYGILTANAEEYTMPKVAMGGGQMSGNAPAAAIAALTANALVATKDVVAATERALSKMLTIVLQWIVARGEPVGVWGRGTLESLAPSDLTIEGDTYTRVEVTLKPDKQQERQMVAGLVATLWNAHLLGFDTALELLEEGGIGRGAQEMLRDVIERAFIEANLPAYAKAAQEQAAKLTGYVNAIPAAPAASNAGAPPGAMPGAVPTQEQLLGALGPQLPGGEPTSTPLRES